MRKLGRVLGWMVISLLGLALLAALVLVLWARSESGRRSLLARVLPDVQERLDGTVRIGALEGDLTRTLVLRDVEVRDADGEVAVRIDRLSATYDLLGLLGHKLTVEDLVVEGAKVHGHSLKSGRFNLIALVKQSAAKAGGGKPLALVIGRARADVEVQYDPPPSQRWMFPIHGTLRLDASASSVGNTRKIEVSGLAVRMALPVIAGVEVKGELVDGPGGTELKELHLTGDTDGAEMEKLSSRVNLRGPWHGDVRARGLLRAMTVEVAVTPPKGTVVANGTVGLTRAGVTWNGAATVRAIDPGALWEGAPHGLLAFDGDGDGENARVRTTLAHLEAEVAGAHAAAHGQLTYENGLVATAIADVTSRELSHLASIGVPGLSGEAAVHAALERRAGHTKIDADVEAHRFAAAVTRVGHLTARVHTLDLQGSAHVSASAIDVGPRLHFDTATVAAELAPRVVSLAVAAKGPQGSDVIVGAHGVRLREEGIFAVDLDLDRVLLAVHGEAWDTRGPGHFRYDQRGVAARLALGAGEQRLDLDGQYRMDGALQANVTGRKLDVRGLARLAQFDRELPPGVVEVDGTIRGTAAKPVIALALTGSIAADRALGIASAGYRVTGHYEKEKLDGALAADKLPLERLAPYLPKALATIKGVLDGKVTISGSPRAPQVKAELRVPRWQWDAGATGSAGAGEVELFAPITIDLARGTRKLVDRLVHTTPITAGIHLHHLDLARLPLAKLGVEVPVTAGLVDGEVKLGGTLHEPTLDATLEAHELTVARIDRIDARLHADYRKTNLGLSLTTDLRGARLLTATAESRIDVHKLVDGERWQDAPLRAEATISSYDLARWKQVHGALTAHAKVHGTLAHPEGDLELTAERLQIGEMRFGRFTGAGHYDSQHTTARFDAEETGGGALHASGELPAGADQPIAARLRIERLSLSLGNGGLGFLRELRGKINADLTLSGPLRHPHAVGSLNVEDGAIALTSHPLVYHDLRLELAASNDRVELKRLAVKVGNGSLTASGSARLDGFATPLGVDVSAQASHFPVRLGSFAAFVDGHAGLHGERKDGVLAVVATVDRGLAQLPKLIAGKKLQSLSPLPDVIFTDQAARRRRAAVAVEQADDAPVKASLKAHIPGPFRVRSSELGTDLNGDLDVEILGEVLRITGTVDSTWGRIELLGRSYEIEHVHVSFDGSPKLDPTLDLRITRAVDAATVIIRVRGTLSRPHIELSSEPPIYSQSQIIGIIVSGDPGSTRISDAATDQKVVGAISGVLVNQIKNQLAPGLPIDVIRVEGDDSAAGTSRLEVGKYITESIYLSYVHQFGAPTGLHPVNANEAQLQYRFKRHYQLETRFGDAGVGAVNFYWSLRY